MHFSFRVDTIIIYFTSLHLDAVVVVGLVASGGAAARWMTAVGNVCLLGLFL